MTKLQDLKQVEAAINRYTAFEINDTTMRHIIINILMKIPLSENMKNLNLDVYLSSKESFKKCLIIEKEDLVKRATHLSPEDSLMTQMIYVKLGNLIAKILESKIFKNI